MVKFADTQKDKEQRRLQQQLAQQMQQLNTATWGNLTGLGGLTPQYLAVRLRAHPGGRGEAGAGACPPHRDVPTARLLHTRSRSWGDGRWAGRPSGPQAVTEMPGSLD